MKSIRLSLLLLCLATAATAQNANNTLRGKVLYQSSGNKPAVGVRVAESDATAVFSLNNGDYQLKFQNKRNGASLALEVGKDDGKGQKLELVNEKEVKAAKLPASAEEPMDIIVCPAGQRDIAAQRYYRILRTTADRELERKKKEVAALLEQKEKDYQKISDLFALIDRMQAALDSAKIREQAFNIASINLDRASQMVKDAVRKIEEEQDVEGALKILNAEALDTAYQQASALKKQADAAIRQVIEGYEFKISLLELQFKYGDVAECYEKIAEIYEREGYDKEQLAVNLSQAAGYWGFNGDYQKQLEFNLKALGIREKALPTDHPDLALSYNNLAETYGYLGDYQKDFEYNQKALAIREKVLSADHPDLAESYSNLAVAYLYLGDYQKELEYNQKALAIREKILSADHPDLAASYNNQARAYLYLGDYQKELEYNLKALAIFEKVLPADHPDLARSYHNLALTYFNLGEHQKASEFILKASAIFEKVLLADHPDLARSYGMLAITYSNLGEHQKALEVIPKALTIYEKVLPADHPELAVLYNNLALTCSNISEHQKALELNLKALVIWEKVLPADHPDLTSSYTNVGRAYRDVSDYEKGIEYGQKAIRIGEALNPKHRLLNRFYANLGITYIKARQYPEAKAALEKSKNLKAEERVYQGWAMYYALQKQKKQAIESLQKAVSLGFKDLKWLETEPDLKNIRKEKGYKDLVEQLKKG